MVFKYSWRDGADEFGANAQAVGERLATLANDADGALHPRDVVADARRETSPLHPLFEWDDRKAAVAHRLTQANEVIRSIVVHVDTEEGESTRAYVKRNHTAEKAKSVYVAVSIESETPFIPVPTQEKARIELERWVRRYSARPELADAVRCAEDALERIGRVLAHA